MRCIRRTMSRIIAACLWELKEIEPAKKKGLLVFIADVEREMTNLVLITKARILNID